MQFSRSLLTIFVLASASAAFSAEKKETANTGIQRMPTVTALDGSLLTEERTVGSTGRPEWTSARRFPGTRVYIQKEPWEFGIESWWRLKHHRDGSISHRLLEEVDENGRPVKIAVRRSSGHDVLDAAALRAVRNWRFEPARLDGKPVDAKLEVPVRFALS